MKHKRFSGIVVSSAKFSPDQPTTIGVLLPKRRITSFQRKVLMDLNVRLKRSFGHLGVRVTPSGNTAVTLLGLNNDQKEARAVATFLARTVGEVTGAYSILRQLRNERAVRSALTT